MTLNCLTSDERERKGLDSRNCRVNTIVMMFVILGAILGLAVGFITYNATGGAVDFLTWVSPGSFGNNARDALVWAIGGVSVGATAGYILGEHSN